MRKKSSIPVSVALEEDACKVASSDVTQWLRCIVGNVGSHLLLTDSTSSGAPLEVESVQVPSCLE